MRALAEGAPKDAVLGLLIDAEAAKAAHDAGIGGAFDIALGGRSWPEDAPFQTRVTVEKLGDGAFRCTGPFYAGADMQLGPMALLRIGETQVRVVIASRKVQAADQEMFRHLGIEPANIAVLGLKSSVHFRADFGPIATEILIARAPGPVVADPADLPYQNMRRRRSAGADWTNLPPVHLALTQAWLFTGCIQPAVACNSRLPIGESER